MIKFDGWILFFDISVKHAVLPLHQTTCCQHLNCSKLLRQRWWMLMLSSPLLQRLHMTLISSNMMTWRALFDPSLYCPPCEDFLLPGPWAPICHAISVSPLLLGRTLSYRPSGCAGVPSSFTSQAQQLNAETKRKLLAKAEGLVTEVQDELSTIRMEMGLLQKRVSDGNLWDF